SMSPRAAYQRDVGASSFKPPAATWFSTPDWHFLLGFSVLIASVGIYELFVGVLPNMPDWLRMEDLDALKGVLVKTIIVVLGISFMGRAVTWEGEEGLLSYGIAIGAVVVALSVFLSVKSETSPTPS
ncbi:YqhA family protein, partial [Salinibacter ruber]|uniref:YqhA family protein n=1 Tax=Salinibacter ruber TaxID=146919 RepID=UPI00216A37D0